MQYSNNRLLALSLNTCSYGGLFDTRGIELRQREVEYFIRVKVINPNELVNPNCF